MTSELISEITMPLMLLLLGVIGTLLKLMWTSLGKKIDSMDEKFDRAMGQIGKLNVSNATTFDRMEHIEGNIKELYTITKGHDIEIERIKERHIRNHPADTFDRV